MTHIDAEFVNDPSWKEFRRLMRKASPWDARSMSGWRHFKGGVAWVMLYGGVPAKQRVQQYGLIDEWPYHAALCQIVSMDSRLVLKHRRSKREEYWYLEDRKGNHKWGKRGPKGKVQTAYRFRKPRSHGRVA